jgi:hypothetical protein
VNQAKKIGMIEIGALQAVAKIKFKFGCKYKKIELRKFSAHPSQGSITKKVGRQ